MQNPDAAVTTDLVLVGGGHSHLFVLRYFAMNPIAGVRITLVTRDLHTPYSGMLPGYIAGHYGYDDAHIDLRLLAGRAGVRIIHAEVIAIDADLGQITIRDRPRLEYDLLSINMGSRPATPLIDQVDDHQFAIKPVDRFIESWRQLERRLIDSDELIRLAIIGAGAGGVELALSLRQRASQLQRVSGRLEISLVTDGSTLLPTHNRKVQRIFKTLLAQRGIRVSYDSRVDSFDGKQLTGDMASPLAADVAIWVTHASPAAWLGDTGLELDDRGFIAVSNCLQSLSHPGVFAAGDIAAVKAYPRPRSGVFAVRQGLPLARNLARFLRGRPLKPFKPQKQFLSLISTGDKYAVASRGPWALQGRWCWRIKDIIDRRFIRRFSEFAAMGEIDAGDADDALPPMRCGGCGSKVGSAVLEQVMTQISAETGVPATVGSQHTEDTAVIQVPRGMQLIQSVDHFSSFIDDPYLFGRIAANHALGDLFAMGIDADSALVIASVGYGSESKQAQDLYQLMSGVVETLQQHGTRLLGGHSSESSQMSCGLSVNGFADADSLLFKGGMQPGEALILTKPLGSGLLFAADMRGRAQGRWIDQALGQMLVSSQQAAHCLQRFSASACTDVTGFGLAGHLFEMARASACTAEIFLARLPLMAGAAELAKQGFESSLQAQNIRIRHAMSDPDALAGHAHYPLLFDPQTAGGLLASVPADSAEDCVRALKASGYECACIIGRVVEKTTTVESLILRR